MKIISEIPSIKTCFLGTYPPKKCGIASFVKDLSSSMDKRYNPKLKSEVIAINDDDKIYNYDSKVNGELSKDNIEAYIDLAKKLNNLQHIKIICVQHEFGLFGGDYGCYLIPFLETLNKPCVITFHTVLPNPSLMRKKIVQGIAKRCSAVVVISEKSIEILKKDYGIDKNRIYLIHHGIPNIPFENNLKYKEKLGFKNKTLIVTHGLLSRGKGIDYAIKALPKLIKKYPNLLFLIIGKVHPGACYKDGKMYKQELENLIKKLKLEKYIKFVDKYLSLKKLIEYLLATDVYIFTNLEKEQVSSGTLIRALGCGRAVVSTPIVYAEELLKDNRGLLVKFKDPASFANSIDKILSDPKLKSDLEKNAYFFTRQMIWPNVALSYLKIFNKIVNLRKEITEKFPRINLNHLKNLTDEEGIIQFAKHTVPDKKSGYTLDDNSRSLILSTLYDNLFNFRTPSLLTKTYLRFIEKSQDKEGNFKNQHKNKEELSDPYSEDAFGRAIWALGFTVYKSKNQEIIKRAINILINSLDYLQKIKSLRAKAFSLLGLCYYYQKNKSRDIFVRIKELANSLLRHYDFYSSKNWEWFEFNLTYANAKIPESLFLAYEVTGDLRYFETAKKTFDFLLDLSIVNEKLYPIGENGWYKRNNKRAFFDQQPIDASSTVQALLTAFRITKNKEYYEKAIISFNWFLGHNHLNQMIYDESTGGCFDGLGKHSLNFNQGAESTISYLIARLSLEESSNTKDK